MQKKILIVGGSHSDIPLIEAAKTLGLYVITTGNRPQDKGHQFSDEYEFADFSNKEEIYSLAKRKNVDAICSGSNDFALLSSSYAAEKLSLPGFDSYATAENLHHKDQFKNYAQKINLMTSRSKSFTKNVCSLDDLQGLSFPLIVKPVDLTGGKGIARVDSYEEVKDAIDNLLQISRQPRFVIEEFFEGTLHSYSTFIVNQKVVFEYFDNEFSYKNPYLVSTSTSPGLIRGSTKMLVKAEAEKIASGLNLVDGILHAQFLEGVDNIRMIEFTRRLPGDFYGIPLHLSTKFNQAQSILKCSLGEDLKIDKDYKQSKFVSRHCAMAAKNGIFNRIDLSSDIKPYIVGQFILMEPGEAISNYLTQKAAIYFIEYPSFEKMVDLNAEINSLIKLQVQ
jgi:biotin carboxylase